MLNFQIQNYLWEKLPSFYRRRGIVPKELISLKLLHLDFDRANILTRSWPHLFNSFKKHAHTEKREREMRDERVCLLIHAFNACSTQGWARPKLRICLALLCEWQVPAALAIACALPWCTGQGAERGIGARTQILALQYVFSSRLALHCHDRHPALVLNPVFSLYCD